MHKSAFTVGYMQKSSAFKDWTWGGAQDMFNKVTINPAVRAGLMGTAGYFGTKWGYNKLTSRMARQKIQQATQDPQEQQMLWNDFQQRQKKVAPWIGAAGAAFGAALPLSQTLGHYSAANLAKQGPGAGKYFSPLFKNNEEHSNMLENSPEEADAMDKVAWMEMSSKAPYKDSVDDMALGKEFHMPVLRPISFADKQDIPVSSSMDLIRTQSPILPASILGAVVDGIDKSTEGKSGLVSTIELAQGLSRAGFGAAAGWGLANVLGTVLTLPASTKSKLAGYGAIGGAILNSGIFRNINLFGSGRKNE
jgi:hypothetical protein